MNRYEVLFLQFKRGEITEEEWLRYCNEVFEKLLKENEDVLKRLKFK